MGQQFYTVKIRILRLFLLAIKQRICQYKSVWSFFLLTLKWICKYSIFFSVKVCVISPNKWVNFIFLQKNCKGMHCFLESTQLEKKFTRPPVVTVATNINSVTGVVVYCSRIKTKLQPRNPFWSAFAQLRFAIRSVRCLFLNLSKKNTLQWSY